MGRLTVFTKANDLAAFTIRICSNEKNFPKHYRWCVTAKIVDAALDINNYITMANSVFVQSENDVALRHQFQQKAIASSYALLSMIDIAYRTFGIDSAKIDHWTGMILEVQNLLRNWKKSDKDRYKQSE
jgi:hypothetical protein